MTPVATEDAWVSLPQTGGRRTKERHPRAIRHHVANNRAIAIRVSPASIGRRRGGEKFVGRMPNARLAGATTTTIGFAGVVIKWREQIERESFWPRRQPEVWADTRHNPANECARALYKTTPGKGQANHNDPLP